MSKDAVGGETEILVLFEAGTPSAFSGFRLPLTGGLVLLVKDDACEYCLSSYDSVGDGSFLMVREGIRAFAADPDGVDLLPALDPNCGRDWQSSVPRFTPAGRRSDLVFGFREGNGGGDGSFRGFLIGRTAKSTFVRRFEALTGGEEVGADALGVSSACALGTGYLTRGILGVRKEGFSDTIRAAIGSGTGVGLGLALMRPEGVLGGVTSDRIAGLSSGSESRVITSTTGGRDFIGFRTFFATVILGNEDAHFCGTGLSSWIGLDALHELATWSVFCLLVALACIRSFSFSLRAS